MTSFFSNRPSEEAPMGRRDPREHHLKLLDEALCDLDANRPWGAVLHLAQAEHDRAVRENDLLALSRAKQLISATGTRGFRQ